jgi:spermidine synthase
MNRLRRDILFAGTVSGVAMPSRAKASTGTLAPRLIHQQTAMFGSIVVTEEPGGFRTMRFGVDGPRQSVVKMSDPRFLALRYTKTAILSLALVPKPQRILVIGLGGGSLPMFLRSYLPQAHIDAAEIDPAVIDVAKRFLNFKEDERMRAHAHDGRSFIELTRQPYDIIILDAYASDVVPKHLTTTEFLHAVKKALSPTGVVVGNLWGPALNPLYASMLRTYQEVFPDLYMVEVPEVENKMIFACPRKIDLQLASFRERARNTTAALELPFDLGVKLGFGFHRLDRPVSAGVVLRD